MSNSLNVGSTIPLLLNICSVENIVANKVSAWPFLVGGVICLGLSEFIDSARPQVHSLRERHESMLETFSMTYYGDHSNNKREERK
jgi:hypothetical protein